MLRPLLLLVFGFLTACAVDQGRGIPAPVEEQGLPAPASPTPESGRREVPPESLPGPSQGPSQEPSREPSRTPEAPAAGAPSPVASLLASADAAVRAGELEQAAALCERALRISPRDGQVWYRLASIRLQQERYSEAEGLARRALSFAGSDRALTRSADALVARANRAMGTR